MLHFLQQNKNILFSKRNRKFHISHYNYMNVINSRRNQDKKWFATGKIIMSSISLNLFLYIS